MCLKVNFKYFYIINKKNEMGTANGEMLNIVDVYSGTYGSATIYSFYINTRCCCNRTERINSRWGAAVDSVLAMREFNVICNTVWCSAFCGFTFFGEWSQLRSLTLYNNAEYLSEY